MTKRSSLALSLLVACGPATEAKTVDVEPATTAQPPSEPPPLIDAKVTGQCGALTSLGLEERAFDLLDGRLTIAAFRGTDAPPREYNVMAAPKAHAQETRTIVAAGEDRFVVLAKELLMLDPGGSRLETEAKAFYDRVYAERVPGGLAVSRLEGPLRGVVGAPREVTGFGDAALLLSLIVAQDDGSLQELGFYVSPHLAGETGCVEAAKQIAATLRAGPRKLERAAGSRALDLGGGMALALKVSADFVVVEQPGPDFTVFHVHKLVPLGHYAGQLLLYVGGHPQPPEAGKTKVKGKLLGAPVDWTGETSKDGGSLEALAPIPGDGLFVHAILSAARDEAFLDELRAIAETLTRVK